MALLRLESLAPSEGAPNDSEDLDMIRDALETAMGDLRAIAAGLRLPELEALSTAETVHRAVSDFERLTRSEVDIHTDSVPVDAPLPLKITIYRVLQEALANSYRHAPGSAQRVDLLTDDQDLVLRVADDGAGFDPETVSGNGSLGLAGIRERVEMLGGRVEVVSRIGTGTIVTARMPLQRRGKSDG